MWRRLLGILGLAALFASSSVSCAGDGGQPRDECGAPPVCGESSNGAWGACSVGPSTCSPQGIVRTNQSRNCYDVIPCSARGRCVEAADGPACAESVHACDAVRSAYNLWLQKLDPLIARAGSDSPPASAYQNSQCPEACKVSAGHCAQGLDTCWFVAYGSDPELDRLAALHESLGCPAMAPCVCPPVPDISCQVDSSGAAGAYPGPAKCMIR